MKEVIEGKLYRGPRPESYDQLKAMKIQTIVCLQSGWHEFFNDDFYENNSPFDHGFNFYNLKCSDFFPPSEKDVQTFFEIMESATGPVYIHCLHGKDRTGFMIAVYRMRKQGWTFKQAKEELFANEFHKFPYLWWLRELKKHEGKK